MKSQSFDHLQSPILKVRSDGTLTYYNFICSQFFKLPPRKMDTLKSISELFQVSEYDLFDAIAKCVGTNLPVIGPELEISGVGFNYTVIMKLIPLEGEVIINFHDFSIEKQLHEKYKKQILELKSTHEQIVKSDKLTALGELIAGISHEISSPLTVAGDTILSLGENLHQKKYDKVKSELSELEDEFSRIRQIVSNMQTMAKNKGEDLSVISLQSCITNAINFTKDLGLLKDIELKTNIAELYILANDSKLQQVFINLLKNSIDALGYNVKKSISINVGEVDQAVQINLNDNGPGVKNNNEIFEMFFTTKELGAGTGLGLPISQKIVKMFHGNLNSIECSDGAHFCIEFPLLDNESFTSTNRYLSGECEIEDIKVLIHSADIKKLNFIYDNFKNEKIILILTNQDNKVEELSESYLTDYNLSLDGEFKIDGIELLILKNKTNQEINEYIKGLING